MLSACVAPATLPLLPVTMRLAPGRPGIDYGVGSLSIVAYAFFPEPVEAYPQPHRAVGFSECSLGPQMLSGIELACFHVIF